MTFNKEFYRSSNFWGGIVALVLSGWGFSPLTGSSVFEWIISGVLVIVGVYELSRGMFLTTGHRQK
ncbi:hypothetical protein [Levilactobacillus cerevisiae]|uniref:hypothetical protein n=1 Tax=Levilactobacillus cerevisiae TaxID=1704076 RepID=UPI000F7A4B6B|nr:hypothetical protein [Levilactobacillus cerevisiae]